MKHSTKLLTIGLLFAATAFVFAKSEQQPGEPPFGLKAQTDAKGTKLNGALFIAFINCDTEAICDASVVLRLRKAGTSQLELFVDTVLDVDPADVPATQDDIVQHMTPAILAKFLPGGTSVKVKAVPEFFYDSDNQVVLTDVQLTVS